MSVMGPIKTISDGLVFYYDTNNPKSYVGEPTTNIIPSPSTNAIPTYGNNWATYNTNQYGTGTYASIGTVSAVTNNVVTMSAAHSLRTYDVMAAQTTGGGVSAGVNYFIKKLSSTTFCLYPYNSSQDGSQGYINSSTGNHKVYDSIELDQKVSINASSFPTMWYGPAHLPNSGLVKEIIPNGFDAIYGNVTNCVRLHYNRTANIVSFYLNGVFDSTSAINVIGNSSSNTIIIGGASSDGYSGGRMFKGYIATAAHYNRCLSASEVLQNYNSAKSRFGL